MKTVSVAVLFFVATCQGWSEELPSSPTQAQPAPKDGGCKMCRGEASSLSGLTETAWTELDSRKKAFSKNYEVTNQDGNKFSLDELCNKPVALTFLYTRCDNPNKCPLAASTMAKLRIEAEKAGILKDVRLLVMTYDPEYDSADVLKKYAEEKGIKCDDNTMMLRVDPAKKSELFEEMNVTVNYNANRVNIHGLQIILLDAKGRYVRSYHTLIWDNSKVLQDLKRLVAEK